MATIPPPIPNTQNRYLRLRLILGDQLHHGHSWWQHPDPHTLYVMMEIQPELSYVRHHIQKVLIFMSAMRLFANHQIAQGHHLWYYHLHHPLNQHDLSKNLQYLIKTFQIELFEYQEPDEYRLQQTLHEFCKNIGVRSTAHNTEHFLTSRTTLSELFKDRKTYLMETFYRHIRRQYSLLMEADGNTPLTGRWNYDTENRKKLPASTPIPNAPEYPHPISHLLQEIQALGISTIGRVTAQTFNWPLTRTEALHALQHFILHRLGNFGTYQDAMTSRHTLLFHSKLSVALNLKLLHPLEVVQAAIATWEQHNRPHTLFSQVEGFVRQIIGWREYMRGVYWAQMPHYATLNALKHEAPLPQWYWTGQTKMACLHHTITQSLDLGYAHHIQRLMVTGNFALLLGVHPNEVDQWYLGIYTDAIEWVQITNTRGMSQYADGGIVGSKPYVSSAKYLHKMSDYCSKCYYRKELRYGPRACPFNSLYWDFYHRHRPILQRNPRINMAYPTWDKTPTTEQQHILRQAEHYKHHAETL